MPLGEITMQLIYRGTCYSLASSTTTSQQDNMQLSYRGVSYPSTSSDPKSNRQKSSQKLTYRGATYNCCLQAS